MPSLEELNKCRRKSWSPSLAVKSASPESLHSLVRTPALPDSRNQKRLLNLNISRSTHTSTHKNRPRGVLFKSDLKKGKRLPIASPNQCALALYACIHNNNTPRKSVKISCVCSESIILFLPRIPYLDR